MFPVIYRGHTRPVRAVAWSPDGHRIASADVSSKVWIWEAVTGKPLSSYETYRGELGPRDIMSLSWSPSGKHIVSGSLIMRNQVELHDAITGKLLYTYPGHSGWVFSVAWSPDGKLIASASGDETVQVWQAAGGHIVHIHRGHSDDVMSLAWSPNGKYIVSGSRDKTVQIWNATTGHVVFTLSGHTEAINEVAWSPDGQYISSASNDTLVKVWQTSGGNNIATYNGHANKSNYSIDDRYSDQVGQAFSVAWSPDSKYIASTAFLDTHVRIWDAFTGSEIFIYSGHTSTVDMVRWSPRGLIVSGSKDNTVQVWPILQRF